MTYSAIKQEGQRCIAGYSNVNGLKMYYEIYGQGKPLVLIHGGGSTIQTSFGGIIPLLAKSRQLIGMELQAHGRTNDRNSALSFQQDADDVAGLLQNLQIKKADILGFSNGGQTAMEIAMRHPALIDKLIICSAFYKRSAVVQQFWDGFDTAKLSHMPAVYQDEFLKVNNAPSALQNMFDKDVQRMKAFQGWSEDQMRSIKVPALILNGNQDVGSPEHAVEMFRLLPHAQLAILPGGHGAYLGELASRTGQSKLPDMTAALIGEFLNKSHPQG
jgi:pimeloyl-ACP methyl ester carboxylesterase